MLLYVEWWEKLIFTYCCINECYTILSKLSLFFSKVQVYEIFHILYSTDYENKMWNISENVYFSMILPHNFIIRRMTREINLFQRNNMVLLKNKKQKKTKKKINRIDLDRTFHNSSKEHLVTSDCQINEYYRITFFLELYNFLWNISWYLEQFLVYLPASFQIRHPI